MSNWFDQVADHIHHNLEEFIEKFFPDAQAIRYSTGIRLNPCPFCGHHDCFSFSRKVNSGNCFSCGSKGTPIQLLSQILGQDIAYQELEKWTGFKFIAREYTQEEKSEHEHKQRVKEIERKAIEYYHKNLLNNQEALEKQLGTSQLSGQRGHTLEGIKAFKVGLSGDYQDFYQDMRREGYSDQEIKDAGKMIWVPEGYFVYPYYDVKGNLVRINTKLYFRTCQDCDWRTFDTTLERKKAHEADTKHKCSADGFSRGDKQLSFYFAKGSLSGKKNRKAILVEGENDVISTWEELRKLPKVYSDDFVPIGIGGKMEDDAFRNPFLRQFHSLYEAFDHDDAGNEYRNELNVKVPDLPVYSIPYDQDFKDIDNFLKSTFNSGQLKEWIDEAEFVDTADYVIERENNTHRWLLKNRKFILEFEIDYFNRNSNQLEGTLYIYKNGQLADKKIGGVDKIKVDSALVYAKLALSEQLNSYYNEVKWAKEKPVRTFWELVDIFHYTKEYMAVIKQLAWYLFNSDKKDYEVKIKYVQAKLNQKDVAEVLKEVNGYENKGIDPHGLFPKIQLSQFFHVDNDDAFFYFSRLVQEGDTPKIVPCLLSNKKEEVRLDLLKRKDPQCLLLINNKYELPLEVPTAIMDTLEVSLQPFWVDRWKNDDLKPEEIDPSHLILEIENFIRKCCYTTNEIYKVLALWIYSTYYYMLFRSGFPYLIFNGAKGTGKSTSDTIIYLLALNAKFALDMTESSLFRSISLEGGTFILDEVEDLTDKRNVNSSGYAKILKGGYADLAYVYRTNMDKGGASERFSVFGPKVISNINGIEDVIADRCIYIKTFQAPEEALRKLVDPQMYKEMRRGEAHSITSRCAISALVHFQKVHQIFADVESSRINTGNARLTQIMRPLMTIAKLVGGDYEENLMSYYNREIKAVKEEIAGNTLEGMLGNILKWISEELLSLKEKWLTNPEKHLYDEPIPYSISSGSFEIDSMHLKTFCEEMNTDDRLEMKAINSAMKNVLGSHFNFKEGRRQTTTTIRDEELQKQLSGKRHIKVYRYYLNVDLFIKKDQVEESKVKADDSLF